MGPNRSIWAFQTPSRDLPDTFQTHFRHLQDTLQTPSRHPPIMPNNTPSILLPDTLLALSRHPSSTFKTPSIHTRDNIQTLTNKFQGQMGPNRSIWAFQTPSRHVSDTFQTPSRHPPVMANKTPSILLPDTLLALSRHHTSTFQTPSIHTIDNIQTLTNIFHN